MRVKSAVFHTSAKDLQSAPAWDRPEFAFIGRSNVGKSSMINLLANRAGLAKVSATPGKTRLLNFFVFNDTWSLVDLPGYGFAKVAKSEKVDFAEAVGTYLRGRGNLRGVFVLIDSRLEPQAIDLDFLAWLGETGAPFALVFTKADKQSAAKTRASVATFLAALPGGAEPSDVVIASAKSRAGRDEVLRLIDAALRD